MERINIFLLLMLSFSITANCQDIQFMEVSILPEARSALTSANNGEDIYVVNGFGLSEQYTDEVFQYSTSQDMWTILTSSTIPKRFASAGIIDNYLYVFNGVTENGVLNNKVEKIDLNDGSIEILSVNPQPSRAAGVATWDNKMYSFGGELQPNQYSNKLFEFNPQNDTWTELTEIPFAGETKGEIVNGKLYVIGGYNATVSSQIDVYNLSTGVWESNFIMPNGISAHATALIGSKIYLVGDFANLTSLAYFNTDDHSFQSLTSNLNERRHCAAEGVGGNLFAIGGNTVSNIQSSISSVQKTEITTSVNEISNIQPIEIFPNPTSNILNLSRNFDELSIYDSQGRFIQKFTNVSEIDTTKMISGVYFITGFIGVNLFQAKFIKK